MDKVLTYKGYIGSAEDEGDCWIGKILNITDLVFYEGLEFEELEKDFKAAVDDYIQTCFEVGKDPAIKAGSPWGDK